MRTSKQNCIIVLDLNKVTVLFSKIKKETLKIFIVFSFLFYSTLFYLQASAVPVQVQKSHTKDAKSNTYASDQGKFKQAYELLEKSVKQSGTPGGFFEGKTFEQMLGKFQDISASINNRHPTKPLSPLELLAIYMYTTGHGVYSNINGMLRGVPQYTHWLKNDNLSIIVKYIDRFLKTMIDNRLPGINRFGKPSEKVMRFMSVSNQPGPTKHQWDQLHTLGGIYFDSGYLSTAATFLGNNTLQVNSGVLQHFGFKLKSNVQLVITPLRIGSKGIPLWADVTRYPQVQEVTWARNVHFKVMAFYPAHNSKRPGECIIAFDCIMLNEE